MVLSRCLKDVDSDGLEAAFHLFEAVRKPRTSAIQAGSSANTWMQNQTNPDWVYGYNAWEVPLAAPERVGA